MIFRIVMDRSELKSPLHNPPQVYRDALLICKLGTEIIALALRCYFYCAMIVTDGAI